MLPTRRAALLGGLLVLSALPGWLPELRRTSEAAALVRLPYGARRARVNGAIWRSATEVARRFPAETRIPIIMRRAQDVDRVVFLNDYLYPRTTHAYWSLDQYRAEAPAPPETPLVYIDVRRNDGARVTTYPEIRAEQMEEEPFIPTPLSSEAARNLILPFATSFDGAPPDSYVTQAVFVSDSDGTLTLTLEPDGRAWIVPLHAGEPLASRDLVYDAYRVLMSGWIRVTATVPVRAGAALVNRGRHRSAPIRIFTAVPPPPRRVAGGDKLWLLNEDRHETSVVVNGTRMTLPPYELQSMPSASMNEIDGSASVLPFTSRKLPDGNTQFVWP
jgi:hypothetical protein